MTTVSLKKCIEIGGFERKTHHNLPPSHLTLEQLLRLQQQQSTFPVLTQCHRYIPIDTAEPQIRPVDVYRIPVLPTHIPAVLGILRQQIIFNEIYRSCFPHNVTVTSNSNSEDILQLSVESRAPEWILITISDPKQSNGTIGIEFTIHPTGVVTGQIVWALLGSEDIHQKWNSDRVTSIIQQTKSIPMVVFTIYNSINY
jgi:hypothetical protein